MRFCVDNCSLARYPNSMASKPAGAPVDSKLRKVTVLLDEQEFERFEIYCSERGFKKSTLTARLIREYLDREAFNPQKQLPLLSTPL